MSKKKKTTALDVLSFLEDVIGEAEADGFQQMRNCFTHFDKDAGQEVFNDDAPVALVNGLHVKGSSPEVLVLVDDNGDEFLVRVTKRRNPK